jgi:uncharacterized integral membrane protein
MLVTVAVLASLAFIGWLIYRAIRRKPFKAHTISYAIATLTGVYTYAFFLDMEIDKLVKIIISILLGAALIVLAAYLQRRRSAT